MNILQKLEMAFAAYLPTRVQQSAHLVTDKHEFILTDQGLKIRVLLAGKDRPFELDLPFIPGESEIEVAQPSVRVVGETALEDFDAHHFYCEVLVLVVFPADSWSQEPDVIEALLDASNKIEKLIFADDLPERLNGFVPELTVYGASSRAGARQVENRTRIHRYALSLYAANADLFEPVTA